MSCPPRCRSAGRGECVSRMEADERTRGNAFHCDCGLLWMNQLVTETVNDQVHRELSEAKCSMNDTTDDGLDDMGGGSATGQRKAYGGGEGGRGGKGLRGGSDVPGVAAGGLGVYGGGGGDDSDDDKRQSVTDVDAGGSAGTEDVDGGAGVQIFDEFYKSPSGDQPLTLVSSLDENTCPGKEQPLVDGAPDAAQNSDRVLWESNKSSGVGGAAAQTVGSSASVPVLLLLSALVAARHY